ncbi:DUF4783 domain-containing protein [Algoriphagus boritolerans]|uniref:DUF4783 domain-containing protein n=1 Tax=Algoriphagus boritolerans TaxID=308111 RepID=UPI003A10363C
MGSKGNIPKTRQRLFLEIFFKKNPSQGFTLIFQNENPGSLSTYIGEYATNQVSFKVFIKVSQNGPVFGFIA